MFNRAFADRVHIGERVEQDNKVRHDLGSFHDVETEQWNFVRQSARQPPITYVESLRSQPFCRFLHHWSKIRPGTNEDNLAFSMCDGANEICSASEHRQSLVEVNDSDSRTSAVRVWNEVGVHSGGRMAEMCARGKKGRYGGLRGWFMKGVTRLEGVLGILCRTIAIKSVNQCSDVRSTCLEIQPVAGCP